MKKSTFKQVKAAIESSKTRSAWSRGVKEYALDILENMRETDCNGTTREERVNALDGAIDWQEYSYAGCSCIYDSDIAERLCNPTELKRTHGGKRQPNSTESWLDVQARALQQAWHMIRSAYMDIVYAA